MYEAFLLYMENHHEEARVLLESYQDKSYTRDDLEFAGIYLYLCTLTAVSYTHLDVYKRQGYLFSCGNRGTHR